MSQHDIPHAASTAATMQRYINRIRNDEKRDYATRYAIWLQRSPEDRAVVVEPVPFHLSHMAAQAVRMRLHDIAEGRAH